MKEAYVKTHKTKSHSESLEAASKIKFRTPTSLVIPVDKKDVVEALEFILDKDKDFIFGKWNKQIINEDKVKEYIINRRTIYDIESQQRTYTNKEVIFGSKNKDTNVKLKKQSSKNNYEKMKKENEFVTSGLVKIFKHSINNKQFYSLVKECKEENFEFKDFV